MKSTVEMLKGKVTTITLRLEGGLTIEHEGKWKKYAIAPEMTVSVGPTDDFEAQAAAVEAYLSAWIGKYLKPINEHYETPVLATQAPAAPVAKTAPVAQDAQQDKTFVVETLSVEIKGGKRYVKAKGGNFKMYGVNVWPEVLAMPPLEWDAETLDGSDLPAPEGLTAIYIEKAIEDKEGGQKMVPDKVTGWA